MYCFLIIECFFLDVVLFLLRVFKILIMVNFNEFLLLKIYIIEKINLFIFLFLIFFFVNGVFLDFEKNDFLL